MRPGHDLGVVGLGAQRQRCLAGGLGCLPVAGVVLHAADQQRDPSGQDQDLPVLLEGQPLALQRGDPAQPGPALGQQLVAGMNGYSEHSRSAMIRSPSKRGLIQV